MSGLALLVIEDFQKAKAPPGSVANTPLVTLLGVLEGEILTHLENFGGMTLGQLAKELRRPARAVIMSAGALIRQGLVRGAQRNCEVHLELLA